MKTAFVRKPRVQGRAAISVLVLLLLAGCGSSELLDETIEQNYPIDPKGSISLTNIDGSIQIYGAHKQGVHLQAIKKAYSSGRLNAIEIHINAKPDGFTIDTTFPPSKDWSFSDRSGTVDYILVVPATCTISRAQLRNGEVFVAGMDTGDVNATIENGRIFIKNCFGNAQANAATGAVSLIYDWWDGRKFSANARITDGNLFALIPGDGSFRIHAEAPNGKIGNDFAEKEERTGATVTKIDSVIGTSPEAEFHLTADDGNIKIVEANP